MESQEIVFSFFVCFFCLSWELLQHVCNLMAMIQKKGKFLFQEIIDNCRQNCFSYQKGWNSVRRCRRSLKGAGTVHPLNLEGIQSIQVESEFDSENMVQLVIYPLFK